MNKDKFEKCEECQNQEWFIMKPVLTFEDWYTCYGVCECGLDIIAVDREIKLDDNCHRHKFGRLP